MARKISLNIDDRLYAKLESHAHRNGESVQDFLVRAVCDALDMWDDFYDCDETMDQKDSCPKMSFFVNG